MDKINPEITDEDIKEIMIDEYTESITNYKIQKYREEHCSLTRKDKKASHKYIQLFDKMGYIRPSTMDGQVKHIMIYKKYINKIIAEPITDEEVQKFKNDCQPNIDWTNKCQVVELMWKEHSCYLTDSNYFQCPTNCYQWMGNNKCDCAKKEYFNSLTYGDIDMTRFIRDLEKLRAGQR